MPYRITEEVSINYTADVVRGELMFTPNGTEDDWAGYALWDGDTLVAEVVSYEGLTVHDWDGARKWYRQQPGYDPDWTDDDSVEDALREALGDADALYESERKKAEKAALRELLEASGWKTYRDDLRGFANEFNLYLVAEDVDASLPEKAYEISVDQFIRDHYAYPTGGTEDFHSLIIEGR